jgi:S1-C subfamily serine protease
MRSRVVFLLSLLFSLATNAVCIGAPQRDPGYQAAENAFQSTYNAEQRIFIQISLIAAGYLNGVPNENFNHRVFDAIQHFQTENGLPATGIVNKAGAERLMSVAVPMLNRWGFQTVSHPLRRIPIWMPMGLGLVATRNEFGLHYEDPQHRLVIDFTTVPNVVIVKNFVALVNNIISAGGVIHYKVLKDSWFVISSSLPGGIDNYFRYHRDGSNVTGFTLSWINSNGNVSAERIAVLMSASLWSAMTGAALLPPPENREPSAPDNSSEVAAAPPIPPPPARPDESQISTGTAFFVTQDGTLVTNAHVVENCSLVRVKTSDGAVSDARIVARDATNDLAILKTEKTPRKIAALRTSARLGEGIEAFGFPHADILATSGNFTLGNITALSGMGDDSRFIQISSPVQAGNSGGPLLDQSGNLVGVVTAKLDALNVAIKDGDLPQNVNFAVKSAILAIFLDSNRVAYQQGTDAKPMDPADIAEKARDMSAFIMCR